MIALTLARCVIGTARPVAGRIFFGTLVRHGVVAQPRVAVAFPQPLFIRLDAMRALSTAPSPLAVPLAPPTPPPSPAAAAQSVPPPQTTPPPPPLFTTRRARLSADASSTQPPAPSESTWQLMKRVLGKGKKEGGGSATAETAEAKLDRVSLPRLLALVRPEAVPVGAAVATLLVTTGISLFFPYAIGRILDAALTPDVYTTPATISVILLGLFAVQSGLIALRSGLLTIAGERIAAHTRRDLFRAIVSQDIAWFDSHRTGDVLTRLTADTGVIQKALTSNVANGLRSGAMAVGGTVMLFVLSPQLALMSLCMIPPVAIAGVGYGRYLQGQQRTVQETLGRSSAAAEEVVSQIRTVRQFARESDEAGRYGRLVFDTYAAAKRIGIVAAYFDGIVHMAANVSLIAVLGYGGVLVQSGSISPGELTAFLMYSVYTGLNAASLSAVYTELKRAAGAAGRIFEIIDRVPAMPLSRDDAAYWEEAEQNAPDPTAGGWLTTRGPSDLPLHLQRKKRATQPGRGQSTTTTAAGSVAAVATTATTDGDATAVATVAVATPVDDLSSLRGDVSFTGVSFSYPSRADVPVLTDFNVVVQAGTSLALVGGSGSGKSTVVALLTRLYDPLGGAIALDGVNIARLDPTALRAAIGVVSQEPALFAATIGDNIAYGSPDASDAEVRAAAVSANAHDFIVAFPQGYDTLVGERGVQLSGGQKQRIALARAILKSPRVLLLDEATSALDAESEAAVMEALQRLSVGRTVITIAHRLSTMQRSDRVAVLAGGRVVECGPFADLFGDKTSAFRALVERQMMVTTEDTAGGSGAAGISSSSGSTTTSNSITAAVTAVAA